MNTVSVSIIKNNPVVYIFKSYMIECIGIVVRLDTCQYLLKSVCTKSNPIIFYKYVQFFVVSIRIAPFSSAGKIP